MKNKKLFFATAVLSVMLTVGIILSCIGGITINRDKKFMETAEKRIALVSTVLQKDGTRKYVLSYHVDGVDFEPDYDFNEAEDYIGKDVKVYFSKETPESIFIETDEIYSTLLYTDLALAVSSAVILCAVHIYFALRRHIIKNGKTELVRIEEIVDVIGGQKILCESTKIRGRNAAPYKSKTIREKLPKEIINTAVTVYYLPEHKNLYYIDTDTIKMRDSAK